MSQHTSTHHARPPRRRLLLGAIGVLAAALLLGPPAVLFRSPHGPPLSKGSERVLANLGRPVHVQAYVTRGIRDLDDFVSALHGLLDSYERASHGKLTYEIIEVKTPSEATKAERYGLRARGFDDDDNVSARPTSFGYFGLVVTSGHVQAVIPELSPYLVSGLEFRISNLIRGVSLDAQGTVSRVGVVTGKGALHASDLELLELGAGRSSFPPRHALEEVNLRGGKAVLDPGLDGLIVPQPGEDYTDEELRLLDDFVMRGKALAVFASAVDLTAGDRSMRATLNLHRLDELLSGYGIEQHRDVVLDWGSHFWVELPAAPDGTRLTIGLRGIVGASTDPSRAPFFDRYGLTMPFPSSLTLHPERQPEATLHEAAKAGPQAEAMTAAPVGLGPQKHVLTPRPSGTFTVAAIVEGRIRSAFGAREAADGARVLVVSASQFLSANPVARALGSAEDAPARELSARYPPAERPAMREFLVNTLDWMSTDPDLLQVAGVKPPARPKHPWLDRLRIWLRRVRRR